MEIDSALEALCARRRDETSSGLGKERARTNVFKKAQVDRADGPWEVVGHDDGRSSSSSSGKGSSEAMGILRGAGLLGMVMGGTTIALSALANNGNTTDAGAYYTARTYNDIGWVVASGHGCSGRVLHHSALRQGRPRAGQGGQLAWRRSACRHRRGRACSSSASRYVTDELSLALRRPGDVPSAFGLSAPGRTATVARKRRPLRLGWAVRFGLGLRVRLDRVRLRVPGAWWVHRTRRMCCHGCLRLWCVSASRVHGGPDLRRLWLQHHRSPMQRLVRG